MGKLIVIDGLDGSGKATQTAILEEKLKSRGAKTVKVSFPDYDSNSSAAVKMYLNGEVGSLDEVNVYAASSFYAVDRYISFKTKWEKYYNDDYIVLCDRYATSNICHQMPKLPENEQESYIKWLYDYEFKLMGLPSPDMVIYLDMDPVISQDLLEKRYDGNKDKKDIHEKDGNYLSTCRKGALKGASLLGWNIIKCDDGENPLTLDEISEKIFYQVANSKILEDIC